MNNKIKGGYILQPRQIMKSDIWNKPPLYIKVWQYLLMKATHQDYKGLKRGQCFTTIKEIQEECSYMQGFVKKTPSYKQIRDIIDYLKNDHEVTDEGQHEGQHEGQKNNSMIVITKVTHGMIVTIVNYSVYQDPSLYEGQHEGQKNEDTKVNMKELRRNFEGHNINKNNNKNNNNKYIYNSQQKLKEWKKENPIPTPDKFSDMKEFTKAYREWTEKKNEIIKQEE